MSEATDVRGAIQQYIGDVVMDCDITAARVVDARARVSELCGVDLAPHASLFREELRLFLTRLGEEQRGVSDADRGSEGGEATGKKRAFTGPPRILSAEFAALAGAATMPWADALAWVRDYVKTHSLQNQERKSEIVFDEALQRVFKRKKATYFQLSALLRNVCKAADDVVVAGPAQARASSAKASKRPRADAGGSDGASSDDGEGGGEESDEEESDEEGDGRRGGAAVKATEEGMPAKAGRAAKRPKAEEGGGGSGGGGGGFGAKVALSDKLAAVLGASELKRTEVRGRGLPTTTIALAPQPRVWARHLTLARGFWSVLTCCFSRASVPGGEADVGVHS